MYLRTQSVLYVSDGPVRQHKSTPYEFKTTGLLTVDLMGPFPMSYPKKFKYALVGAFRGKLADNGLPAPLFPLSVPLKSKEGHIVAAKIKKAILFVESVHTSMYVEGKRVFTALSDKGGEFENKKVQDVLNDLMVFQTLSSGCSPQSSGAAEANVRIIKQVMRRLLENASLKVGSTEPQPTQHLLSLLQLMKCRNPEWNSWQVRLLQPAPRPLAPETGPPTVLPSSKPYPNVMPIVPPDALAEDVDLTDPEFPVSGVWKMAMTKAPYPLS
eukprot:394072-Amphidinium_carterae.2